MNLIGEGVRRQKSPKTDLYLKPPVETMRVTEQASWLNKTSFSKNLLSVALFILTLHRYHRSLKHSRNRSEIFPFFSLFFRKVLPQPAVFSSTEQLLCSHFSPETHMDSRQSTDPPATSSSPTTERADRPFQPCFPFSSTALPECIGYQPISPLPQLYLVNLLHLDASGIHLLRGLGTSLQSRLQLLHTTSELAVAEMCNL